MGVRPVVVRSIEDTGGQRCVDIVRGAEGYGWTECRRDPEDGQGWRHLAGPAQLTHPTEGAALDAARAATAWLADSA